MGTFGLALKVDCSNSALGFTYAFKYVSLTVTYTSFITVKIVINCVKMCF